jgi:hypothetical protein
MADRSQCAAAAAALTSVAKDCRPSVVVGFDGFIDNIIDVVAKRADPTSYVAMGTISELGQRVLAAAGNSANFEMVVKQSKIGGNGPIMANALCSYDYRVTAIGILGEGAIDPVFKPLADRATKTISLGGAATTDALEFSDGKIMLGKLLPLERVTYATLIERIGIESLKSLFRDSAAVAMVNWTMTMGMTEIWRRLAREVLPGLRADRPLIFVDLADPAKRTLEDLRAAFAALQELQQHADVLLGMNGAELRQVLTALDLAVPAVEPEWEASRRGCELVQQRLGLSWAMCHLVKSAACAWGASSSRAAGSVGADGFFEPHPKITTGAGDHFNAGFTAALLAGLDPRHALHIGGATSGYYVRTAVSPSREQVVGFLRQYCGS